MLRFRIPGGLALVKIKVKRETVPDHKLKIADLYNISIGSVKKLVATLFDKEKYVFLYKNLWLYLRAGSKLKKIHCILEFNQSQRLKPNIKFKTQKEQKQKKIMTNLEKRCINWYTEIYGKTM